MRRGQDGNIPQRTYSLHPGNLLVAEARRVGVMTRHPTEQIFRHVDHAIELFAEFMKVLEHPSINKVGVSVDVEVHHLCPHWYLVHHLLERMTEREDARNPDVEDPVMIRVSTNCYLRTSPEPPHDMEDSLEHAPMALANGVERKHYDADKLKKHASNQTLFDMPRVHPDRESREEHEELVRPGLIEVAPDRRRTHLEHREHDDHRQAALRDHIHDITAKDDRSDHKDDREETHQASFCTHHRTHGGFCSTRNVRETPKEATCEVCQSHSADDTIEVTLPPERVELVNPHGGRDRFGRIHEGEGENGDYKNAKYSLFPHGHKV